MPAPLPKSSEGPNNLTNFRNPHPEAMLLLVVNSWPRLMKLEDSNPPFLHDPADSRMSQASTNSKLEFAATGHPVAAESRFSLVKCGFAIASVACFTAAIAGALLPLIPTTPFLLLGFFCLSRVSHRWHTRLMKSRWAAPVREWKAHRAIRKETRRIAFLSVALVAAIAILLASSDWRALLIVALGTTIGCVVLYRVPVRDDSHE